MSDAERVTAITRHLKEAAALIEAGGHGLAYKHGVQVSLALAGTDTISVGTLHDLRTIFDVALKGRPSD